MTTTEHLCHSGGTLVSADDWLPSDPRDYQAGGLVPFIGCNNLSCQKCKTTVQSALGFSGLPSPATLAATADWTTLPEYSGGSQRLYACGCTVRLIGAPTELELPAGAYDFEEQLPWRCAGHPSLSVPGELDGLSIDGDWSGLAPLVLKVRTQLHDYVDRLPGFQAHRLYAMLGEPAREGLSHAVAALVGDDELRPRVVLYFAGRPMAAGFDEVARYVASHPDQVASVAVDWGPSPTLAAYLADAFATRLTLSPRGPGSDAVRDALRVIATHPPGLGATVLRLARVDPGFVQDRLGDLLLADPAGWRSALQLVRPSHAPAVIDAGMALVKANAATRDEVLLALRDAVAPEVVSEVARMWPPDTT